MDIDLTQSTAEFSIYLISKFFVFLIKPKFISGKLIVIIIISPYEIWLVPCISKILNMYSSSSSLSDRQRTFKALRKS